jgi:hypothetical protein
VLEGLRGEESIAALCRPEGIAESLYYNWSKGWLRKDLQELVRRTIGGGLESSDEPFRDFCTGASSLTIPSHPWRFLAQRSRGSMVERSPAPATPLEPARDIDLAASINLDSSSPLFSSEISIGRTKHIVASIRPS